MPAKKKSELHIADSPTSNEEAKPETPKRISVGDWVMFASPLFVQLHLVARPRDKENIVAACGLANPPDFSGRPAGPRCKRCNALRDVTAA